MISRGFTTHSGQLGKDYASGVAAIDHSTEIRRVSRLISVSVRFGAAPTTSENITITIGSGQGTNYNVVLLALDPSVESVTSLVYVPDNEIWLTPGDSVDVAYTNTDRNTYGLIVTVEEKV